MYNKTNISYIKCLVVGDYLMVRIILLLSMHRGEHLALVVQKMGVNRTKLVKQVGFSRATFYFHIQQFDLPFIILKKYGDVMHYDFSIDFPEMTQAVYAEKLQITTFEDMKRDRDRWKDKYYELVDEHLSLKKEIESRKNQ